MHMSWTKCVTVSSITHKCVILYKWQCCHCWPNVFEAYVLVIQQTGPHSGSALIISVAIRRGGQAAITQCQGSLCLSCAALQCYLLPGNNCPTLPRATCPHVIKLAKLFCQVIKLAFVNAQWTCSLLCSLPVARQ